MTPLSPSFSATLTALGLTPQHWEALRWCAERQHGRHFRQLVKQVQRCHTGRGVWWQGKYVKRKEEMSHG